MACITTHESRREPAMTVPVDIFTFYEDADKKTYDNIYKHLATMRRNKEITLATNHPSAGETTAYADEKAYIQDHLHKAALVLLLISSDFLANDEFFEDELG